MPDDSSEFQLPTEFGEANAGELFARAAPTGETPASTRSGLRWVPPTVEGLQRALPQYEVIELLGLGGMGAVYKGVQRSLDRFVAIKILPSGIADEHDVHYAERFKIEAKAMARLSHPGIVSVFDTGETAPSAGSGQATGLLYFVMEFIEGTDVQQLIARGPLPPERALAITTHVCDALGFAHDSGILHRDIKPANIMVDKHGRVKVADFGLAKVTTHESAGFTRTDLVMGTPEFMAPEAMTSSAKVDQRADLYAVGVMLYAMLTGTVPRGRFAHPSTTVAGLDPRFDAIVDKAMQADRDHRYPSAAALRADLERVRTGPIPVAPPKPPRRRKAPLLIGVAVVVLAVGGWLVWSPVGQAPRLPVGDSPQQHEASEALALQAATKDAPFANTLGMKFVPVPITGGPTDGARVLFSVWETRVQDYEVFASEAQREWPKPSFVQEPAHPVVLMSWDDAVAFCGWLTERERKAGKLAPTERYRLPSDHEWSCAVGIGERENPALPPWEKHNKLGDVFPWGSGWPPPAGAGNFTGEETAGREINVNQKPLTGYRDEFVATAPVGSFPPNRLGLYDLAGNVWEWCEEWCDAAQTARLQRGGGWDTYSGLRSSLRTVPGSGDRGNSHGFRCVLQGAGAPPPRR
ncbi:MAG: bifunctional serine/threonine-protein kinase/formylglycine-generating enzyme family protein [Chthoniobacteraceae bacterium]